MPRLAPTGLLVAMLLLGGCSAAPSDPATSVAPSPTESSAAMRLVVFGDSWAAGSHCGGCETFADLYATGLQDLVGAPVDFVDATYADGGSVAKLLASLSGTTGDTVAQADVIVISIGTNELVDTLIGAWPSQSCGGADGLDCVRTVAAGVATNFDQILTHISDLREGRPTAIRLLTMSNEFLSDEYLLSYFPAGFGLTTGAAVAGTEHDAVCGSAEEHGALCVDLRPVLNGPNLDTPQDIEAPAAMSAVAEALLSTGLPELDR